MDAEELYKKYAKENFPHLKVASVVIKKTSHSVVFEDGKMISMTFERNNKAPLERKVDSLFRYFKDFLNE